MRLIDADVLKLIYTKTLDILAREYGADAPECRTLAGVIEALDRQATINPEFTIWKLGDKQQGEAGR